MLVERCSPLRHRDDRSGLPALQRLDLDVPGRCVRVYDRRALRDREVLRRQRDLPALLGDGSEPLRHVRVGGGMRSVLGHLAGMPRRDVPGVQRQRRLRDGNLLCGIRCVRCVLVRRRGTLRDGLVVGGMRAVFGRDAGMSERDLRVRQQRELRHGHVLRRLRGVRSVLGGRSGALRYVDEYCGMRGLLGEHVRMRARGVHRS